MNKHSAKKYKGQVTKRVLRMYNAYNPKYFPVRFLQLFFSGVSPYFNLWFSSEIVTALYEGRGKEKIFTLIAVTLFGNLLIGILGAFLRRTADIQLKILESEEAAAFIRKVLSLDYDKLENPDIRKQRRKIIENGYINWNGVKRMRVGVERMMSSLIQLIFCILLFVEMVCLIVKVGFRWNGVLLFAAMCICTGLNVLAASYSRKKQALCQNEGVDLMLEENRLGRGYSASGMDNRIYRQQELINIQQRRVNQLHLKIFSETERKSFRYNVPTIIAPAVLEFLAYLIVFFYCAMGVFPVGSVIKYVGYLDRMASRIGDLLACIVDGKLNEPYLQDYLAFFDIENDMYQGSLAVEKRSDKRFDIEFKNVSFRYAGAEEYALKDINLKLKVGERLAVVGMNGSGKTTFIKLLCRLYDPTEGEILMNDFNIRKYDYRQYLDIFSVVFQDYKLLAMPLGNNVAAAESWDSVKAERLLEEVGFGDRYARMENKLNTPLYKDFDRDGVNVSGGEAQKIALARALYRDAPFIILDEPTAALDPLAEAEIYSKFDEIVGDKTAIYISHRLSSCRFCDKIAVFDGGRIVQVGTHEELLADEKGRYYELWNAQAQYYKCERNEAFLSQQSTQTKKS